jgi:hypothetical protein
MLGNFVILSNILPMGRNNEKNIKKHNDKLHKAQAKAKGAKTARLEKLSTIIKKFNNSTPPKDNSYE